MISFDTFSGHDEQDADDNLSPSASSASPSVSSCGGDTSASDSGAEMQRDGGGGGSSTTVSDAEHDVAALADHASSDDSSAEFEDARSTNGTADDDAAYDLFHEHTIVHTPRASRRSRKHRKASATMPPAILIPTVRQPDAPELSDEHPASPPPESGGRVLQLFHLLTFKNQAGDAKSALVQRLVAMTNVKELVMSKATEEQIASAANDAITEEILASVDREDKRRQSVTGMLATTTGQRTPSLTDASSLEAALAMSDDTVISTEIVAAGHYSPYRVLELVDVLDSTTGGMVKLILTNVRSRAPFGQRSQNDKAIEFCSFCSAYSDHTAAQHRCRICGVAGQHRSKSCPKSASSSPSAFTPPSRGKTPESSGASTTGKSYCSFCSANVNHTTQTHQCRNCGALGAHRSRSCSKKTPPAAAASSKSSRWVGSPIETFRERKFCDLCGAWRYHTSTEHKCSICSVVGEHRSKNCPRKLASKLGSKLGSRTPRSVVASSADAPFCSFCAKKAAHRSEEHRCRVCHAIGVHRSGDCPERKQPQSVLSYSVTTASKVFEKVLPASASSLVLNSIDKVGDVDTILKKTLQRIGVWGGGSQTPITTPYAPPVAPNASRVSAAAAAAKVHVSASVANAAGVYVLSYAEGRSVVPERILKYMRLLMHHEISVNAFSVVVRFDPRSSHWELEKPGMVTPRSLPSSPTMSEQLKKRLAKYTLQTLLDARQKLIALAILQHNQELLLMQQQQQLDAVRALEAHASGVTVHSA